MKKANKVVSILVTLAMIVGLLLPMGAPAFANTDNYASSVPKVENDTDGVSLGSVIVREDADTDGFFKDGDVITFTLPSGVTYSTAPTEATYTDYVSLTNGGNNNQHIEFVAGGDNFISVKVVGSHTDNTAENRLTAKYSGNSAVDIDSDVTGDIKVEIEGDGTAVTSEFVTVARVIDGATVTTISDVKSIGLDKTGNIGTIKIAETAVGKLEANNDYIKLVLPNDFEWDTSSLEISGTAGLAAEEVSGDGEDTLVIKVTNKSSGSQAGFIALSGLKVYVPDDATVGEVEMTVKGNEVTQQDIVVCKAGDFGFTVETSGDVPSVVAGCYEEDVATINIDDVVDDSWISGRTVTLELPSWAEWADTTYSGDGPLVNGKRDKDDENILKFTVKDGDPSGEAELDDLQVNIDADAPAGDLTVKIYGSAGVEGELVIAKVERPVTITASKPELVLGVQGQKLGDITITETKDEAIAKGKWVILEAPYGLEFSENPDVEVTAGDMDIDNDDIDGRYFAFQVTGDSSKPSTVKISNIVLDVDRTIPVGDVVFKVYLTENDKIDTVGDSFDKAIDNDNYEDLATVAAGTVVNPAPEAGSVLFNIGSTVYTANGVTKVMDVAPYIKDGRTYVPVKYLALALGVAEENIKYENGVVTLVKGDVTLKLTIGDKNLDNNGTVTAMDVAPEIVNGRTMLPARFVAEGFGAIVGYTNNQVVISLQ